MPKVTTIPQLQNEAFGAASFANADGTTAKLLYAGGANDSVVKSIFIASDDSADRLVQLIASDGVNSWLIDTISVPAGYGTDGTHPAVDGLANPAHALNTAGKKVLSLKNGLSLSAKMVAAVTAAKTVTVTAFVGDY